ncbi:MAG TPA: DUF4337 domain-containing protein [Thermodesulfovibrionales bacterium]|nr:DUF4337 domain-containing protein [Thermodesulfovibrionales bacterium]
MPEVELPKTDELEEVRGKRFTRRVALTTAVFAVLLAVTSLGGNHAMKEMLLAQQQSSDQWAFYQSKVVREHLYRLQKSRLETDILERGRAMNPEVRKQFEAMLKNLKEEEVRYNSEKKKIEEDAKELERERDKNRSKDPYFDYAEVFLQIAIVMASISILALSLPVFYFSLVSAILGTVLMLNGYLLIFRLPFFQ